MIFWPKRQIIDFFFFFKAWEGKQLSTSQSVNTGQWCGHAGIKKLTFYCFLFVDICLFKKTENMSPINQFNASSPSRTRCKFDESYQSHILNIFTVQA